MRSILFVLFLAPATLWASECPDLTGSYKCPVASDALDTVARVQDGVWHYSGDQINVFGEIIADAVERLTPGYENIEGVAYKYKAFCQDQKLIIVSKTLYDEGKGWTDIKGPTQDGGRAVYYLKGNAFKAKGVFYEEYPQRSSKKIDWEKDSAGRKVKRDFNLSCRRVRS